jgi:glycosyltransferase involved in cell wall biosynthesis
MRLLFVHERFGALGGAEANVLLTGGELRRRGHTVGLVHGDPTGRQEEAWNTAFPVRYPLGGCRPGDNLRFAIQQFKPDVLFVHKMANLAVIEVLAECGIPVVRMVHDHDLYCMRGYKYNFFTRHVCQKPASLACVFPCGASIARDATSKRFPIKWVSYRAKRREINLNYKFTRMVVASTFMKEELLRNGFSEKQIEIHAPVPRPAVSSFESAFSDRNRIVYAGQIIRGKGVDVLLESLAKVRLPFECLIVGDGSHRPYCENLNRQLGLSDRVHFTGFVPQEAIAGYYRDCTVAAVSSVWPEPFGAVGLEAMRCGLPVVAFDAGAIREWVSDGWNGYLVPWMDRQTFAERVEHLLRNKILARQMGERGRQWADERFNFGSYITGLEDLFARVTPRCAHRALVPVS